MLRYLERAGLVVPGRTPSGYRVYGVRELNQLQGLARLRREFGVELREIAFALRLRREPPLKAAVETWLSGTDTGMGSPTPEWVEWEQRKHERLLAA
jgi:DNA-binding transcriptional MerR regulator